MGKIMRVFLTGHRGYVGNVLAQMLSKENFEVIGCDVEYFPQGFIDSDTSKVISLKKDIRDLTKSDLKNCSAILHLAALSNDPLGEINPSLTEDINFSATIDLAKKAKEAGVERFVFSSSCSSYGANSEIVDETSNLAPITAYAKSKINSERELIKMRDKHFSPIILRNATVYGISPSQRLDLVVNNLVGAAVTTGKVKLLSDGTSWRPLLHVDDMAKAFILALKSPKHVISGEIFNVGSNEDNYTTKQIAEKIETIIPESKIEYAQNANKDTRSYKVNFDKIRDKLGYTTRWNLEDGIKQIYETMKNKEFSESDFKDKAYYRVTYIKWLLENGILDNSLKFKN